MISVDIEASGPIPGEFSMLSLGACVVGNRSMKFYVELKPINANFLQIALDVCKLSMEELSVSGQDPEKAMESFKDWVVRVSGNRRPVFCSFGTFDWMFAKWYLVRFGDPDLFGPNGCDMKSYYSGMMNAGFSASRKKEMDRRFLPAGKHTHNALDDALEQAEMFEKFLEYNNRSRDTGSSTE